VHNYKLTLFTGLICLAAGWVFVEQSSEPGVAHAHQPAEGASDPAVLRAETRLVLVDAVVTDKKGNYLGDLVQKDFRVWEDGKEQSLSSFSFEESTDSHAQPRYMVLFFDNSTMDLGDQIKARDAAVKFIDANAGPNRLIAIAEFGGTVRISQNFTADAARLKQVVKRIKGSAVSPNGDPAATVASLGAAPAVAPSLVQAEADFGVQTVLWAMRDLAKGMSTVPGRKTLVMLTAGFPMSVEYDSELSATINTCNKANVAIYPIDVRGLVVPGLMPSQGRLTPPSFHHYSLALVPAAFYYYGNISYSYPPALKLAAFAEPAALFFQHGGGGTGGGGTGGGGGHGGGTGGGGGHGGVGIGGGGTGGGGKTGGSGTTGGRAGGYNPSGIYGPAAAQPRIIVPDFPKGASDNQQVLYQLAGGTGGFVILNTNDLLGGLERIARDQNQYYLLGYKPTASAEGSCHTLKVKVERGGTNVRARSGYCNVKPLDLLAGNAIEKDLETRASGEMKGNVAAQMQAPFFYTAPNEAQVHLAVDIPSAALKFEKTKGKEHTAINILGIAYKADGSIASAIRSTSTWRIREKLRNFRDNLFTMKTSSGSHPASTS
jgi:VWFA-related protein